MAEDYRAQAEKCRSLARRIADDRAIDALLKLADEYDARAEAERAAGPDGSGPDGDEAPRSNEAENPTRKPE